MMWTWILYTSAIVTLQLTTQGVDAHGHVNSTTIDGVFYDGFNPDHPEPPKIFRSIEGDLPVMDLTSPDIQCGIGGGKPAPLSAPIQPGGEVVVDWGWWPGSHMGPVTAYLAKCPGSCSEYIPGNEKVWFKIIEAGKAKEGTYYNIWPSHNITNHRRFHIPIPRSLSPGNYILRHEIISLHTAQKYPGIEVQPSCLQITVGGNEKGIPRVEDLVAFPGAYGPNSEGVVWNVWDGSEEAIKREYVVPGPRVAVLVEEQ